MTTPTTKFPSSRQEVLSSAIYKQPWYYAIELVPGLITPGAKHLNFGLTRRLLSKCEVQNRSVLDIGTMEAAVPILASRRRAKKAVGIDIAPFYDKIEAIKHYTGAQFHYYAGLTHGQTFPFLKEHGHTNFDIVVLSGVLYHCFGPLHTLAMARSLLRTGGLMIVETFSIVDEQYGMFFNWAGMFTPDPSSYFLITVPLLDYILRYFKLLPIECLHSQVQRVGKYETKRVATVCRAVNDIVVDAGDDWMRDATTIVDYVTLFEWGDVDKTGKDPVSYAGRETRCDLYNAVVKTPLINIQPDDVVIRLSDME